jgi:hypothetical protein
MGTRHAALLLSLVLWGCGTTGSAIPPPKARKWEGPWMETPVGLIRKTLYYGPWQCRQVWLDECQSKCAAQKLTSMGCIWVADIKTEVQSTVGIVPVKAGGRLAVTHCCCDYPLASDLEKRRNDWNNAREKYRRDWIEEYGGWPTDTNGNNWPGHHVFDLRRGGPSTTPGGIIPVPLDTHSLINKAYPECYDGKGRWNIAGPYWPYTE